MIRNPLVHLATAAAVVAASIGLSAFVGYRLIARIDERASLEARIATLRSEQAAAVDAASTLRESAALAEAVRGYFVASGDVVVFLGELEQSGKALGTVVQVVSVSETTSPRPALSIALQIRGPFAAVMRTLGAIEYGPHDARVTSLSLDRAALEGGSGWTAAVGLTVGTAPASP